MSKGKRPHWQKRPQLRSTPAPLDKPIPRCIFCGGGNGQVKQLLASADGGGAICDVCATLAVNAHKDIIDTQLSPVDWEQSVRERVDVAREGLAPAPSIDQAQPTNVEIQGQVLEPQPEPSFYSCSDDCTRLTSTTPEEAIEEFLDSIHPEFPETITVYGWRRTAIEPGAWLADRIVETVLETLDEVYGDPDGDATEPTAPMKVAAQALVDAIAVEYQLDSWPHAIDESFKMEVNAREWVKENIPEWLAGLPPPNDDTEGR